MFADPMDKYILEVGGFNAYEISELEKSPTPINLDEPAWRNAAESRAQWIQRQADKGRSQVEINYAIQEWYAKDERRTPWDWLREAYGLPDFVSPLQSDPEKYSGALAAMREREAARAAEKTIELRGE